MGMAEHLTGAAVAIVGIALIVLIWMVTSRAIQDQRAEIRDHAEQRLVSQTAVVAEQVRHELLMIDQSIALIQDAWKENSDTVDLTKLRQSLPALTSVSGDIFIADDQHIIRQDIVPAVVGQGIGAAYVSFPPDRWKPSTATASATRMVGSQSARPRRPSMGANT
jgi:hypothetical protein